MRPMTARLFPAALLMLAGPSIATAQSSSERWMDDCRRWGSDRETHCEVRELRLGPSRSLTVDAGPNGGIRVRGTDRQDILVRARVQTHADRLADAEAIARDIRIDTARGRVQSDGPRTGRRESWSVSYEIEVPRTMDLDLRASNGGLTIADVEGRMVLETTNGGIHVDGAAGDVRGHTTNGGVTLTLAGDRWKGAGVDLSSTNGGVRIAIPDGYSAELETGTTNGGFDLDIPVTLSGRIGRRITTRLGQGGPTIRAITVNGGVRISRR